MSIEKITSKIIRDAQEAANVTKESAKAEADGILKEAEARAAEIEEDARGKGKTEKEKLISRKKSVADIDSRKMVLAEKQKLISACFDDAAEKLASMESDDYIEFLKSLILNTGEKDGELILNERDAEAIGEKLVKALGEADAENRMVLAKETRNIQGGFLLKKGLVYINGTIEALFKEAREELLAEAAAQLFQ